MPKILRYLILLKLLLSNIRFSALFRHLEEFTLWFWQTNDLKSVIYVPNISLIKKHHKSTTLVCTILNHVSVENSINHSSQRYANLYSIQEQQLFRFSLKGIKRCPMGSFVNHYLLILCYNKFIQSINPEKATTFTSSANYYPWKSNNFHLYQKDMMGGKSRKSWSNCKEECKCGGNVSSPCLLQRKGSFLLR